jgi:ClpP class serine protease
MNFQLAREIYGLTPFCVDSFTLPAMLAILSDIKNGVKFDAVGSFKNDCLDIVFNSEDRLIRRTYELENQDQFNGVGIVKINGPILMGGGASTLGMLDVSKNVLSMAKDNRVKGFIFDMDSGGGSTAAVEIMVDTINEVKAMGKPVYVLISKGGTLASAAYGIASAADAIYYQSDMSMVGSLGTMLQTEGRAANSEKDGVKYIRLYATKSVLKNKSIEEALNNDNYTLLVNELLDPVNERFISTLQTNRPKLTNNQLDGNAIFAKDDSGIYLDGKSTIEDLFQKIITNNNITNTNINFNSNTKMTKQELQSQHPELYSEVLGMGVTSEYERVQSWLAHNETDSKTVMEGIESGLEISSSQREKLLVKSSKIKTVEQMQSESAKDFQTGESTLEAGLSAEQKELNAAFNFKLK